MFFSLTSSDSLKAGKKVDEEHPDEQAIFGPRRLIPHHVDPPKEKVDEVGLKLRELLPAIKIPYVRSSQTMLKHIIGESDDSRASIAGRADWCVQ